MSIIDNYCDRIEIEKTKKVVETLEQRVAVLETSLKLINEKLGLI